jgi:hypothetical protein
VKPAESLQLGEQASQQLVLDQNSSPIGPQTMEQASQQLDNVQNNPEKGDQVSPQLDNNQNNPEMRIQLKDQASSQLVDGKIIPGESPRVHNQPSQQLASARIEEGIVLNEEKSQLLAMKQNSADVGFQTKEQDSGQRANSENITKALPANVQNIVELSPQPQDQTMLDKNTTNRDKNLQLMGQASPLLVDSQVMPEQSLQPDNQPALQPASGRINPEESLSINKQASQQVVDDQNSTDVSLPPNEPVLQQHASDQNVTEMNLHPKKSKAQAALHPASGQISPEEDIRGVNTIKCECVNKMTTIRARRMFIS